MFNIIMGGSNGPPCTSGLLSCTHGRRHVHLTGESVSDWIKESSKSLRGCFITQWTSRILLAQLYLPFRLQSADSIHKDLAIVLGLEVGSTFTPECKCSSLDPSQPS